MSLSSSMLIAVQSMLTDQAAMNVVSNNIANVNTPGYTREIANLSEAPPVSYAGLQYGTGVTLESVQSVTDSVLQLRLNQETQNQGKFNTLSTGLNQIQTLFNEPAGSGLQNLISQFFNSFQQLSADPTNSGLRQAVTSSAQSLAAGFNQTASALVTQQQDADQAVVQTTQQINQLTAQIAQLNGQISESAGGGQNANTFVDQRSELINQLSQLVDVQSINSGNGSLTLTTTGGAALVVGNQSFNLQTQVNPATGFNDVYSQGTDITSSIQSGNLAADIQLRDQEIPSISSSLDTLANSLATSVNTQNAAGIDLNGNPGGNIFVPPTGVAGSATALANLQNQNIVSGQTPINYYSGIVFQVGSDASNAASQLSGEQLLVQQLQDQVNAVSGVSLDEEGANLVLYQNAYNASARVASIVASLFQTAIDMTSS